jgi:hypothetical protein
MIVNHALRQRQRAARAFIKPEILNGPSYSGQKTRSMVAHDFNDAGRLYERVARVEGR